MLQAIECFIDKSHQLNHPMNLLNIIIIYISVEKKPLSEFYSIFTLMMIKKNVL